MAFCKTYIQQLSFNGIAYTKGQVVELFNTFGIVCKDIPFKFMPEKKELPTRDWLEEDGLDVYVPPVIPMKSYDMDVKFLYVGDESNIRSNIKSFIKFLYGRNTGATGGRLSIYNEYVGIGRKDVVVSKVQDEIFFVSDEDPDCVAQFSVTFTVYDPVTDVTPTTGTVNGNVVVTDLSF